MSNLDINVLSFDIDNTLIDLDTLRGGFSSIWHKFASRCNALLTYNTGRLYSDVLDLIDKGVIPAPDFIIGGVGTHIYDFNNKVELNEFSELLEEGWDLEEVEKLVKDLDFTIALQPQRFQHSYKRSYFFENASASNVKDIELKFIASSLDVNIVYSGNKYLDVLPKRANKGNALEWLLKYLGRTIGNALVAGDSGNDLAMFDLQTINGILVGNASSELSNNIKRDNIYRAKHSRHVGVVEGLVFYDLMPKEALEVALSEFTLSDY